MNILASFFISLNFVICCFAEPDCADYSPQPTSLPSSDVYLYLNNENISNNSVIYDCNNSNDQCQQENGCRGYCVNIVWCIKGSVLGSITNEHTIDSSVSATWVPSPTQILNLSSSNLCLCTFDIKEGELCNATTEAGEYKCIIDKETLFITYKPSKATRSITSSVAVPITKSLSAAQSLHFTNTLSLDYTNTHNLRYTSIQSTQSLYDTPIRTTTTAAVPKWPPSTTSEQTSTTPHYTGIGLLLTTNLLTAAALIGSITYILYMRRKKNIVKVGGNDNAITVVKSDLIESASIINIETEINNDQYDTNASQKQEVVEKVQQEQTQSTAGTDIYSYAGEGEYDRLNNDIYATPKDLTPQKKSSTPPPIPPPYEGNGLKDDTSPDHVCIYASIEDDT